jgi:type IV pilus assembly protein PilF
MKIAHRLSVLLIALLLAACVGPEKRPVDTVRAAELNTRLGLSYLEQGRLELARMKLQRALDEQPDSSRVNWANALLYEKMGEKKRAESLYRKATKLNPEDAEALNNFGTFLCREGRIDEGIKRFEKAASNPLYKTPEYALTNAGLCMLKAKKVEKAEAYFRRALDHNTRYASALYQMALLTYQQKRYLSSRAYRERLAAVLNRLEPKVLWLCVVTERAMSNYSEADSCERTLKTEFPTSHEASQLY